MRPGKLTHLFAATALILAAPQAARAEARVKLFAGAVWVAPIDDSRARLGNEVRVVELADDIGWEAGVEWRMTSLLGLEAAVARTTHDVSFGPARLGTVELEPIYISVNFHLIRTERTDWWIAPTLALFEWRNAGFSQGVEIDEDRDEAFGATVGFDYELDERWTVTAALRYVDMQLRFGGGGEVAVDPLSVRAGVGIRF